MDHRIPRFQIIEQIGQGQFSNVYKARMLHPGQTAHQQHNNNANIGQPSANSQQSLMDLTTTGDHSTSAGDLMNHESSNDSNLNNSDSSNQHQSQKEQFVALKRIKFYEIQNSSLRTDCIKEVRLLQQLNHPNIINYSISFIERNELFIVLEFADGGDLSKLINYFRRKKTLLNESSILKYYSQVCSAVQYIHSKRILHRDIKPANIFMSSAGCVKLGDFGLGRFFGQDTRNAHSYVGTFYYMSPERIRELGYDFSSDVWSLGCVLYELITLNSPFSILFNPIIPIQPSPAANTNQHESQQQQHNQLQQVNPFNLKWIIERILRAEYPSLAGYTNISSELRHLAVACLSLEPSDRPNMESICASVQEAQRRLELRTNNNHNYHHHNDNNGKMRL